MKHVLAAFLFVLPSVVFAHAVPVSSLPPSGSMVSSSPGEITIVFSDHVASGSPVLKLFTATGTPVLLVPVVDNTDSHVVRARLPEVGGGATVLWGVVSADDGHFTNGAIGFVVEGSDLRERTIRLNMMVFVISVLLVSITLRGASFFYFEQVPRCGNCERAYTLLESLVALALLLAVLCAWFFPPPEPWVKESRHGDRVVRFSAVDGVPLASITVEGVPEAGVLFEIEQRANLIPPMEVSLTPIMQDGHSRVFAFPLPLLAPHGVWHLSLTFVSADHYDVEEAFNLDYPNDVQRAPPQLPLSIMAAFAASVFVALLVCRRVYTVLFGKSGRVESARSVPAMRAYALAVFAFALILLSSVFFAYPWALA